VNVVVLEHHRVGLVAAGVPHRPTVEALERTAPRPHVVEAANPREAARRADDLELAQRVHPLVAQLEQEVILEIADESLSRAVLQQIVAQLDCAHRPTRCGSSA
jgi:hypothetical protein